MSAPFRPGQLNSDPSGLKSVSITRETLTIDLRPLATAESVWVEAIYQLNNPGSEKKLELVFIVASWNVDAFQVWLDDKPIPSYKLEQKEIPASWNPPRETPALQPEMKLEYEFQRLPEQLGFTITLPAGAHTLKARYKSDAGRNLRGKPLVYWQFAYVLAPAREWAGFGGLDVTVQLPPGWQHAITPLLQRTGDELRGSFPNVPADHFALTVQAPTPRLYDLLGSMLLVLFWFVVGAGGVVIAWCGWRRKTKEKLYVFAAFAGVLWAAMIAVAGFAQLNFPEWILPEKQIAHYGYDDLFAGVGILLLSAIALILGFFVYLIAAGISARKTPTATPQE